MEMTRYFLLAVNKKPIGWDAQLEFRKKSHDGDCPGM